MCYDNIFKRMDCILTKLYCGIYNETFQWGYIAYGR